MNEKIIARQIAPELQESPLNRYDDMPENVFVFGNTSYIDHGEKLEEIDNAINTLTGEWIGETKLYPTWGDAVREMFPPSSTRGDYTENEIAVEFTEFCECFYYGVEPSRLYRDILRITTGREYTSDIIRGSVQGEWNNIIYPAEYGRDWFDAFEKEYFNTGTEWEIDENGNTYFLYCTTDDPRAEIAEITNTQPEEIKMLYFDGWTKTPKYTEVSPW